MFFKPKPEDMQDPEKMKKLAKMLGIELEQVQAKEVIIKTDGKDIVISNPEVTTTNMFGKKVFQVAGEVKEVESKAKAKPTKKRK